ncbi:MAG: hypothetical protein ACKORJ_07155, partial [Bacteroidota bacterium]
MTEPFSSWETSIDYQIVHRDNLAVLPLAGAMIDKNGSRGSDGLLTWSVARQPHVIRLRTTAPVANLNTLDNAYADDLRQIALTLETFNAMIVPGGMHPLMDPFRDQVTDKPKNDKEKLFRELFQCAGHAWVNQCPTKLTLPFADDEAFGRLHAAVRIV